MSFEFIEVKRKKILNLQLAPMIDIFTLIIVFLLLSTVLGTVSVTFPKDLKTAKSISTESVEAAPQVVIDKDRVILSLFEKEYPLRLFLEEGAPELEGLKAQVTEYIKNAANESKNTVVNVNVVADASTPYRHVFSVVKALRQAGFQAVLFIAEGDPKK